jgi:predicted  nucleic acid-binding Zn-ribbon protein
MDATITNQNTACDQDSAGYKSRPGALIWCFRKSRDRWKNKHQELKSSLKKYQNRVADVTKSREQWRLKAETASQRLDTLEAENAELMARISTLEEEKKTGPSGFAARRSDR